MADPNFIGPILTPKVSVASPAPLPALTVKPAAPAGQVLSPNFVGPTKPNLEFFKYDDNPEVWDSAGTRYSSMEQLQKAGGAGKVKVLKRPVSAAPKVADILQPAAPAPAPTYKPLVPLKVTGVNGTRPPLPAGVPYDAAPGAKLAPETKPSGVDLITQALPTDSFPSKILNPLVKAGAFLTSGIINYMQNYGDILAENQTSKQQATAPVQTIGGKPVPYARPETGVLNKTGAQLVGESALAALDIVTPGIAKTVVIKSLGEKTVAKLMGSASGKALETSLKELAKYGVKEGTIQGLQYGIANALASGSTDPKEIAQIIIANTAGGAALGTLVATTIPAIANVISSSQQMRKDLVNELVAKGMPREEATRLVTQGGFFGNIFDTPKVSQAREAVSNLQSKLEKELQADTPRSSVVRNLRKAIADAEVYRDKVIRAEKQAGFVDFKAPVVRSEVQTEAKPSLPPLTRKESLFKALKDALYPIKATDEATQATYRTWANSQTAARELANTEVKKLADVPAKQGWDTILKYEQGQQTPFTEKIAKTFDGLHAEAIGRGLDVPYRQNYIPQMYNNSPEEVALAVSKYLKDKGVGEDVIQGYLMGKDIPESISESLKLNPNFIKQRVFPDYATAQKYGLTPKYTHPAQLAAAYRQSMEESIANRKLITDLLSEGKLVPSRSAPRGWQPVSLSFAPKGLAAEPKLAAALNGLFRDEMSLGFTGTLAAKGAKASKLMQEIALSAGFPGTDVNFFAIGQLYKEIVAGKVRAIPAFIRANFDSATIKFFEDKAPIIQKMADNGIDISDRVGNFRDAYKNMAASKTLKGVLGDAWHTLFQKRTFSSFMPQLYVNTFEGAYKSALKKGLTEEAASTLAADITRKYHGLLEDVARGKGTEDKLSAIFFAPKFREGVVSTLWNTGKSVTTELRNPAYKNNRKLATGMVLTYGLYQYLNKELSGQYTWQNEPGHEFDLRIPLQDGSGVLYTPLMPSFLSLPRNLGSAAKAFYQGDLETGTRKVGSLLSMPIQITTQVMTNSDYFGNPIYKDTDTRTEKLQKIGQYLGLQANHPYLKLVGNYINNKQEPDKAFQKSVTQSLLEASELPVKLETMDRLSRSEFYRAAEEKTKQNAAELKRVQPVYDQVQKLKDDGRDDEAQQIVDQLSDQDYEIYKKLKASGTRSDTMANEARIYKVYQRAQELKANGQEDAAQQIVDGLTDEEYKAYSLLKKRFSGGE